LETMGKRSGIPSICWKVSRTASRNSIPSPERSLSYHRAASKASISASGLTPSFVISPIAGESADDPALHPTGGPHRALIGRLPCAPPMRTWRKTAGSRSAPYSTPASTGSKSMVSDVQIELDTDCMLPNDLHPKPDLEGMAH